MSSADAPESGHDALLSDTALAALELREQPFARPADDAAMFADEITAEQLADIRQALITGDDLLLILGERGAGKSTLLAQLAANSGLRIQCFSVHGSPRFSTRNLFVGMLEAFKVRPPEKLKATLDELIPCLQAMIGNNTLCVVVLDDAQTVPESELTTLLSGMLYLNSGDESLLRIAFAAPPEFEDRIPELLPEGADLPYSSLSLEPFDAARAGRFLGFRLERAGHAGDPPFDEDETAALVERSGGHPAPLQLVAAETLENAWGEPGSVVQGGAHAALPLGEEEELPPELLGSTARSGGGGFLGGRAVKLALGTLAGLMILGGLLLFRTEPDAEGNAERYRVVEQRRLDSEHETERLRLLQEDENRLAQAPADEPGGDVPDATAGLSPEGGADATGPDGAAPVAAAADPSTPDTPSGPAADAPAGTASPDAAAADTAPDTAPRDAPDGGAPATPTAAPDPEPGTAPDEAPRSGDSGAASAPEPAPDPVAAPTSESTSESTSGPEPAPEAVAVPEPVPEPVPTPAPEPASASEPAGPDTASPSDAESAPAPRAREPADAPADATASADGEAPDGEAPDGEAPDGQDEAPRSAGDERSPVAGATAVGVLESPNWVLVQDAGQYTVQMIASTERAAVETFLIDASLPPPNSIFAFDRRGTTWYALVHGLYPDIDAARDAVERMPPEAQTNQPWIRSIGRIQSSLKEQN